MPTLPLVRIWLGPSETSVTATGDGTAAGEWVLPMGCEAMFHRRSAGGSPTPAAIEEAIQVVEDQLALIQRALPTLARWVFAGPSAALLRQAMQANEQGEFGINGVERLFQQLAARAEGAPSARGTGWQDPAGDAGVLLLRECMHHWGFEVVALEA